MTFSPLPTSNRRGDLIRVTVRTENPAGRIQVTDADGRPLLRSPATGLTRLQLRNDAVYKISYWVGSGERHIREWRANEDDLAPIVLPDDTRFISAPPLPESGDQDEDALRFASQDLPDTEDEVVSGLDPTVFLSARLRHPDDRSVKPRTDLLASLQAVNIGWINNNEFGARIPRPVGKAVRDSSNALLKYEINAEDDGMPMLAIAPPYKGADWIFRPLLMFQGRYPRVFLCATLGRLESESLIDWRLARYSLYLGSDSDHRYVPTKETRFEEALIERLGRGGLVSSAVQRFIQYRDEGNFLAHIAGWLLASREQRPAFRRRRKLLTALEHWRSRNISLLAVPDVEFLHYYWQGEDKYINLSIPIFSASWRQLAYIPRLAWLESKVGIDPLSWHIANSANLGGVWFSWSAGHHRSLAPEETQLSGAVAKAPSDFIRLVQRVQEAVQESNLDSIRFSETLDWTSRTLLERRILDQILARGSRVPDHEGTAEETLDEIARGLGMPLPIVSLSVNKLAGQEWITENPPPAPSNLPATTALPEVFPNIRHQEIYASSFPSLTGPSSSIQTVTHDSMLSWSYSGLKNLTR